MYAMTIKAEFHLVYVEFLLLYQMKAQKLSLFAIDWPDMSTAQNVYRNFITFYYSIMCFILFENNYETLYESLIPCISYQQCLFLQDNFNQ